MLPVLVSLGPIQIRSYGVFLVLAFLVGTFIIWREGQKQGYNEEKLLDLSVTVILSGLLGSRLYYVTTNFGYYKDRFGAVLKIWEGGLSFHGALIGGILGFWWFVRKNKWPILQVADFGSLALLLGMVVGKIGSLLNGDDYGVTSSLPWAIQIPGVIGKRHPSPIYEIILILVIYFYLLKRYRVKERSGGVFYSCLALLGVARIFTEFFRDNPTHILNLKEGFWGGSILATVGFTGLYWFYKSSVPGEKVFKSILDRGGKGLSIASDITGTLKVRSNFFSKKLKIFSLGNRETKGDAKNFRSRWGGVSKFKNILRRKNGTDKD